MVERVLRLGEKVGRACFGIFVRMSIGSSRVAELVSSARGAGILTYNYIGGLG